MSAELLPGESLAVKVAKSVSGRGEPVGPNIAAMLVLTVERLTGIRDYTAESPIHEELVHE